MKKTKPKKNLHDIQLLKNYADQRKTTYMSTQFINCVGYLDIMGPSDKVLEFYYNFIYEGISNYKTKYRTYIKSKLIENPGIDTTDLFSQLFEILDNFKKQIEIIWELIDRQNILSKRHLVLSLNSYSDGKFEGEFYSKEIFEFEDALKEIQKEYLKKELVILKDTAFNKYDQKQLIVELYKKQEDESPFIFLSSLYDDIQKIGDGDTSDVFFLNFYDLLRESATKFVFESHRNEITEWYKSKYNPKDLDSLWIVETKKDEWEELIDEDLQKKLSEIENKIQDKISIWKGGKLLIECAAFCELLYVKHYFVKGSTRIKSLNKFAKLKYNVNIENQ